MNDFERFNGQFRETPNERHERQRDSRHLKTLGTLRKLIADLSDTLTDEGPGDWTEDGLYNLRRRVANALPASECPDWLNRYRDPPVVQS